MTCASGAAAFEVVMALPGASQLLLRPGQEDCIWVHARRFGAASRCAPRRRHGPDLPDQPRATAYSAFSRGPRALLAAGLGGGKAGCSLRTARAAAPRPGAARFGVACWGSPRRGTSLHSACAAGAAGRGGGAAGSGREGDAGH